MAGFAGAAVRPRNKLSAMGIRMTIRAVFEPGKINGGLRTQGNSFVPDVASGTGEIRMFPAQRKVRFAVVKCPHRTILPACFVVAGFTSSSIRTSGKTSVVGIGMTVRAA